jgi:hypothetical protein
MVADVAFVTIQWWNMTADIALVTIQWWNMVADDALVTTVYNGGMWLLMMPL